MYLASIDINTGSAFVIATLPVVGMSDGTTFFDEANHTFVLQSSGSFYSINVTSGNIIITSAPTTFNELQFDNTSGMPYGLVMGTSMFLVKINVSNGTYIIIDTLPTYGYNSVQTSFDEINHVYVFCSNGHLYSLDINTGHAITSPIFPVGLGAPPQNVIELHFDNSNGTLYALHWGTEKTTGVKNNIGFENLNFNIFPNPISTSALINLNKLYQEINISIH